MASPTTEGTNLNMKNETGIELELDNKKMKQYLTHLQNEISELKDLVEYANGKSWMWLLIMVLIVVVNVITGFFHSIEWVDALGLLLALIALFIHYHWEGKVKMLKGARGAKIEAIRLLIRIGVGDKVKAAFHSLLANLEKIGEPKPETPAPAKKRVVKKIPVKREKK